MELPIRDDSESIQQYARRLAQLLHKDQSYGEGVPYDTHLSAVVAVLERFGYGSDKELIAAAWLHDSVEDIEELKVEDIDNILGSRVARLVDAVTDPPGANRREKKALAYPRIRSIRDAIVLKLADRIANVESCVSNKEKKRYAMYIGEYSNFRNNLYMRGHAEKMWEWLGQLLGSE